jgi:hypothetical protein
MREVSPGGSRGSLKKNGSLRKSYKKINAAAGGCAAVFLVLIRVVASGDQPSLVVDRPSGVGSCWTATAHKMLCLRAKVKQHLRHRQGFVMKLI